ncbi:MAG TPA: sialidase family protein, partial [Verrucomicrobiae bacterium]|nr:sialidase family protein [Verrucomicrobiae bacterium]
MAALALGFCAETHARTNPAEELIRVQAAGFILATNDAVFDGTNKLGLSLVSERAPLPFCQSAIKQDTAPALQGPDSKIPYFRVRFAMPIPPENATNTCAELTGMDPKVFTHNQSPGFTILPNGDALAIYFSTPPGQSESARTTTFVQARLRYGAVEWDMPELFLDFENENDQSGLLWNDHGKIWFFGGGRGVAPWLPFKMATSTDNGATWTLSLPLLDKPAERFTAQPITSTFRGPDDSIYLAMDGDGAQSFLWRSTDDGI